MAHNIHVSVPREDSRDKSSGRALYTADLVMPGMLYAKTLRSTKPRARIISISKPELPEGYAYVDASDIPGMNIVKMIVDDQPFFATDVVNYIGEPILLVVGPDKQVLIKLWQTISVTYEDIPAILEMTDCDNPSIPPLKEHNAHAQYHIARGDIDAAFQNAATIVEGVYETGYQEQLYMEPQAMLAHMQGDRICVEGSMQCPYYVKNALIQGFGWDASRIRVIQRVVGGAFGGKEDYPSILAGHAAFAAYKTGKPVLLVLDRGEDIEVTPKRHPSRIRLSMAINHENRITGLKAHVDINAGASTGLSNVVLQRALFNITGAYAIPALDAAGRTLATNTVPSGAFRGFGAPQAIFAMEMHMSKAARQLGIDSLDFKKAHMAHLGDMTATGGHFRHEVPLPEILAKIIGQTDLVEKQKKYKEENTNAYKEGRLLKGLGVSLFLHGCGFTGSGERDHIKAVVKLKRREDGKVAVLVASVDMGQGPSMTLRKIAAHTLDIPLSEVVFDLPDTDVVPDSGPTVASRTAMIVGKLVQEAAELMKLRWDEPGAIETEAHYKHPDAIHWDDIKFSGDAYPAYSWGVVAVEVAIDPNTMSVRITDVHCGFDVGEALDERIIEGQIDGGMTQGLGYGLLEVMRLKTGKVQQRSVTDYIIPTSMDFPKIHRFLYNKPYSDGPFGAKGAGELTLIGAAPALADAIGQALDLDIDTIPVTPEYLMQRMKGQHAT